MTAALRLDRLGAALGSGLARVADAPPPPTVGGWTLGPALGRGGSSTVYDAWRADESGVRAAVKVARAGGPGLGDEAAMLDRAAGPGVVALQGAGVLADGRAWLALERLHGEPVTSCVRRLDGGARMRLFARLCEAVGTLHARGVVHADLKPSNAFACDDGRVLVLDLGSAVGAGAVASGRAMTPEFAAPEQIVGGPLTPATDTYALGLLLHEMLCGRAARVPWALGGGATTFESVAMDDLPSDLLARRRRRASPALHSVLDVGVQRLLRKALATDRSDRFPSALALAADVHELLSTLPAPRPSVSAPAAAS